MTRYSFTPPAAGVRDVYLKPDGTVLYTLHLNLSVIQYPLSTPWDIRTTGTSSSYTHPYSNAEGLCFGDSGSKMYIADANNNRIYEYDLSTPWDVSTGVSLNQSVDIFSFTSYIESISISDDGTKFYLHGDNNVTREFGLTTAWDISGVTAINENDTFTAPSGAYGFLLYDKKVIYSKFGTGTAYLQSYDLSTSWDLTTLNTGSLYTTSSLYTELGNADALEGVYISPDGYNLYLTTYDVNRVHWWNLVKPFDISTMSSTPTTRLLSDSQILVTNYPNISIDYQHAIQSTYDISAPLGTFIGIKIGGVFEQKQYKIKKDGVFS